MPAGLLLSPTDRAERPGDGALAASLPPAAGPLTSPAGTTSGPFGESPVGAVPFSVMRRPSSGLRLRRFPLIPAPEPPSSRAIPARWLGQRHGHRTPHPRQGPAMASLPCLGRHASFLSCPLSREYRSRCLPAPPVASDPPPVFPCRTSFAAVRPSRPFQARRLCAQPAFFQPSRHLCAKKNDFVKKNANTGLSPPSLPDKSACSPPESPPKTGPKNRKNQEITDFFRQSALTSPAKHVSVFSIAAGLQAVLGITCGVSVTFERVFFHVQVHLCWEPPLGRY